jgi:hypothetical protein
MAVRKRQLIKRGTRIELAITLIDRMKGLFSTFENRKISFDSKETVIDLNGVHIRSATKC